MIISWLLHSIEPEIAESMMYCLTTQEIWEELEPRYGKANGAKIYQLQKEISITTQGNQSVSSYFAKLKAMWDKYSIIVSIPCCTCQSGPAMSKLLQDQKLMQFLMGLNDDYKVVRGNVLMMTPLPSVSQSYSIVLQEEKQREISSSSPIHMESAAMIRQNFRSANTNMSGDNPYRPQYGGGTSNRNQSYHARNNIYNNNQMSNSSQIPARRNNFFCTYCKMQGHTEDRCYKLYPELREIARNKRIAANVMQADDGYTDTTEKQESQMMPSNFENYHQDNQHNISSKVYQQLVDLLNKHNADNTPNLPMEHSSMMEVNCLSVFSSLTNQIWVIDSGASDHITPHIEFFDSYEKPPKPCSTVIPNGLHVPVKYIRTVTLFPDLVLHNVFHIPQFHFSRLAKQLSSQLIFTPDACLLQAPTMSTPLALSKELNGLY